MKEFRLEGRLMRRRWLLWLIPVLVLAVLGYQVVRAQRSTILQADSQAALAQEFAWTVPKSQVADFKRTIKENPGKTLTANARQSLAVYDRLKKAVAANDGWAFTKAYAAYQHLQGTPDVALDTMVGRHITRISNYDPTKPALNSLPTAQPFLILVALAFGVALNLTALTRRQEDVFALMPTSKLGIYWHRLVWTVAATFGAFLLANLVVFLYLAARGGIGRWDYPLPNRITGGTVTLGLTLLAYFGMMALWVVVLAALGGLARTLSPKLVTVLAVLLAVLLLSQTTVFQSGTMPHLALYWLPNYVQVWNPIGYTLSEAADPTLGNVLFPLQKAMPLLAAYAAAFAGIGAVIVAVRRRV
ncbi:hypothetical protein [Lacticaseibacillus kribbianus]|uniref:hypothetical protein n=1 Tax=Lacticaseibacillus kribbianus TaxID=2926292 RepID=UPI001CD4BF1F|nr:hypothetical protein [Lacticaseibacillus kribbianus]